MTPSPESSADRDFSGIVLGDYQLIRRLGRGAMADVYLAQQQALRRHVALKILQSQLATDENYIRRFRLEAQAAASLVHANIVQIYDVGCIDGMHFIAQEYVPGQNLAQWLARHGPPDARHALAIMRQVAAGLAKAGEAGIVHRDIKPENIMLADTGEVKVADFGLARVADQSATLNLTQVGVTMGTPLYMSPEQVEGKPLDGRSDIYSFGVTCHHMLTGQPPFHGESPLAVAVQHLHKEPPSLEAARPDLPAALCRVVQRAMAKQPADRFATAQQLCAELSRLRPDGTLGEAETAPTFGDAQPSPAARTAALAQLTVAMQTVDRLSPARSARSWPRWTAAIVVAFAAGSAVAWTTRPRDPLAGANPLRTPVEKRPTILGQWILAVQEDSEQGWQSIRQHYPHEEYYVRRADQQLARRYLREDRWAESLQIFERLASLDKSQAEFRSFGLAGQAVILSLQGKHQMSQQLISQLLPLRDRLEDPELGQMALRAARTNRRALAQAERDDVERWLEEKFGDETE